MTHETKLNQNQSRIARRDFVKTLGGAVVAGAAAPLVFNSRLAHAGAMPARAAETTVGEFYASLSPDQTKSICLPFDHELRQKISPNWHVRKMLVGDDSFSKKQRAMVNEIVRNVTTEDGYDRLQRQMLDDDGGIESYSVAIFGTPGEGKFEWELTGRHLTLRADGDSVDKAAFGGPIIYGHGEEEIKENLFYYQTKVANEVFEALDAEQRKQALLKKAPPETKVAIQGSGATFPGISVKQLSSDQKDLVKSTIKTVIGPYRDEDRHEVVEIIKANGGLDALHIAFYEDEDIDSDKVWDIWRVEGPSFVCHFRGAPHVHAYINVAVAKGS